MRNSLARNVTRSLALFAGAAPLFGACALSTSGLGEGTSSSTAEAGGSGGATTASSGGAGGGACSPPCVTGESDRCPGLAIDLTTEGATRKESITSATSNDLSPSCDPQGKGDVVYAVTPRATGTLTVTVESEGTFDKSLSIRSTCANNGPPATPLVEFTCDHALENLTRQLWVREGRTIYVVVDGEPHDFMVTFKLSACGDMKKEGLEECDDATEGCHGCVLCSEPDEFWDAAKKSCYRFLSPTDQDWPTARDACLRWGGDLAALSSQAEFDEITNKLDDDDAPETWVGAYARELKCSFAWTSGEPFRDVGWAPGEPDNRSPGMELCSELNSSENYALVDTRCTVTHSALCERTPASACGDGIIEAGEECDDLSATPGSCRQCSIVCGADEFKDPVLHHCYKVLSGADQATWDTAKDRCANLGGYLAAISSAEEEALIHEHMTNDTWIGLHDVFLAGFDWVHDEDLCFTNWVAGQPDGIGEDCVEIRKDGNNWSNEGCDGVKDYVCEREP